MGKHSAKRHGYYPLAWQWRYIKNQWYAFVKPEIKKIMKGINK
jgi:hypothetical protein